MSYGCVFFIDLREKKGEGDLYMLLPHDPCWGSNPKPQAPDMMGNQPVTSLVYGMAVNQLSHNGQA